MYASFASSVAVRSSSGHGNSILSHHYLLLWFYSIWLHICLNRLLLRNTQFQCTAVFRIRRSYRREITIRIHLICNGIKLCESIHSERLLGRNVTRAVEGRIYNLQILFGGGVSISALLQNGHNEVIRYIRHKNQRIIADKVDGLVICDGINIAYNLFCLPRNELATKLVIYL